MLNQSAVPSVTYLKNYTVPAYLIETVDLIFELGEFDTIVTSRLQLKHNPASAKSAPLVLDGQQLELQSLRLNDQVLTPKDYQLEAEKLIIPKVPADFSLEVVTRIKPQENTALSGLYRSSDIFCTQCEAQGFRRITYFLDRPDVLARYTTTIIADKNRYPVMLSNGNKIAEQDLDNNRHSVTWQDPFKKPCYLFALVAGQLDCLEDSFTTQSGRVVKLQVFVDPGQSDKAHHAMASLRHAMAWDEKAYGREYDLDIFMIVAIHDFNMGAMENKGLNIFNAKYILARPETATDIDYAGIELVVGHEYLHNWSGNRITCRDWFQLSLKEGLTVFREQEFTAAMTSQLVERIDTVRILRHSQFREDSGPLAHPVQPDSYIEINNFYTSTIYNKGSEVIRMMKVLLGPDRFRAGMDLYFSRHDGNAVTIEDFVKALEDANHYDLSQFRLWYHQAGTPLLTVTRDYDAAQKTLILKIKQECPPTPGQPTKKPYLIPLAMGLLNSQGQNIPLQLDGETSAHQNGTRVLALKNEIEVFRFINVSEQPVPSLLRHFSAPVKLQMDYSDTELRFLLAHDSDGFNRWEAGQQLACRVILRLVKDFQQRAMMKLEPEFIETYRNLLQGSVTDKSFLAELLTLPSETYLGEQMAVIDIDAIYAARQFVRTELAQHLHAEFFNYYQQNIAPGPYIYELEACGSRKLKNICLVYLMLLNEPVARELCLDQFNNANNMTDQISALSSFVNTDCEEREQVLAAFYQQWQAEQLVVDKWFGIQARCELPGTLGRVKKLLEHPAFEFKNPNKVRSLIGVFCNDNQVQFHDRSGSGYEFLADQVLRLDQLNPQTAARLLEPMTHWQRFDSARQALMRQQLERIVKTPNISKDVYEIASKSLV